MKNNKYILIFLFIALTMVLSSCSGSMAASSWPGISGNDDTVFAAYASRIFSLRLKDGGLNWRYPEKVEGAKTFFAPPAIMDNNLYVGDYKNTFYSLNMITGAKNWEFTGATNRYIGGATVFDNLILAPNADHYLYALDPNGNLVWKFEARQALWAAPLAENGVVYLSSMDHYLYALDLKTGTKIWESELGGAIVYSPSMNETRLFVATMNNEVVAVNKSDGKVLWRNQGNEGLWSQPVIRDGKVFYGDFSGKIYAVNAEDGSVLWDYILGEMVSGAPAIMPNGVVFAGENGKLLALDFDGNLLWNRVVDGKLYTGPVVVDGQLILGIVQGDAVIRAFNFEGSETWPPFIPAK